MKSHYRSNNREASPSTTVTDITDHDDWDPENRSAKREECIISTTEIDPNDQTEVEVTYIQKIIITVRIITTSLDHISDIGVLVQLWKLNTLTYFLIGLCIDLLPGIVTFLQFCNLQYSVLKSLFLLFHPANIYIHSLIVLIGKMYFSKGIMFSLKVAMYSSESRGLLEAPIQLIFTSTLIALSILPSPFDDDRQIVIQNAYGAKLNLSFLPIASVIMSFITILIDASMAFSIWVSPLSHLESLTSWIFFLLSTILFRLQVWILLCVFLGEFVLPLIAFIFITNMAVFLWKRSDLDVDPFLMSVYSITFPIVSLKSIQKSDTDFSGKAKKGIILILSSVGTIVLLVALWVMYTQVIVDKDLNYSASVRIGRDSIIFLMASSTILGLFAFISPFSISTEEMQGEIQQERSRRAIFKRVFYKLRHSVQQICLILLTIAVFVGGLAMMKRNSFEDSEHKLTQVCHISVSTEIEAFYPKRLRNLPEEIHLFQCKEKIKEINDIKGLTVLGCFRDVVFFEDNLPTSPLDDVLDNINFVLLKGSDQRTQNVKEAVRRNCPDVDGHDGKLTPKIRESKTTFVKRLYRRDGRCGMNYTLPDGETPAQCHPYSQAWCCSEFGYCGNTPLHCNCEKCINYGIKHLEKRFRDDARCGDQFPLSDNTPSECDRNSSSPCCNFESGYCGASQEHCDCIECVDYRHDPPRGGRVRNDGKCGYDYPGGADVPGECFPFGAAYCCSSAGFCGSGPDYCDCKGCVDYSKRRKDHLFEGKAEDFNGNVRKDGKCGEMFPLPDGSGFAECDPDSPNYCCNKWGHCASGQSNCDCHECTDFRRRSKKTF